MASVRLRKVGGSTMLAIPPNLLAELQIGPESVLDLVVRENELILRPQRKRYSLKELLDQCDPLAPLSPGEREWSDAPDVGAEIIP